MERSLYSVGGKCCLLCVRENEVVKKKKMACVGGIERNSRAMSVFDSLRERTVPNVVLFLFFLEKRGQKEERENRVCFHLGKQGPREEKNPREQKDKTNESIKKKSREIFVQIQ